MQKIKEFYEWFGIGGGYSGWHAIDTMMAIIMTIIALLMLSLIAYGIWSWIDSYGQWYHFEGKVVGRAYEPATSSTSVGMIANGSGGVSPMVTSSSSPESFDMFVRLKDNTIQKLYVSQQRYFDLKDGDKVDFWKKRGRLSKAWIDTTDRIPNGVILEDYYRG